MAGNCVGKEQSDKVNPSSRKFMWGTVCTFEWEHAKIFICENFVLANIFTLGLIFYNTGLCIQYHLHDISLLTAISNHQLFTPLLRALLHVCTQTNKCMVRSALDRQQWATKSLWNQFFASYSCCNCCLQTFQKCFVCYNVSSRDLCCIFQH